MNPASSSSVLRGSSRSAKRNREMNQYMAHLNVNRTDPLFSNLSAESCSHDTMSNKQQPPGLNLCKKKKKNDRSETDETALSSASSDSTVQFSDPSRLETSGVLCTLSTDSDEDHENELIESDHELHTNSESEESSSESSCSAADSDSTENDDATDSLKKVFSSGLSSLSIPLITKPNVTAKDHLLAAIAMSMRHNLSHEMTLTILKWTDSTVAYSGLPKSKTALWAALNRNDSASKRHLYCSQCRDCLGDDKTVIRNCSCGACGLETDEGSSKLVYFLEVSLHEQLVELLAIPGIANELKYRFTRRKQNPDAIEDIYDSDEYRKLCQPGHFLENSLNFSYIFNTDGASISNSSKASVWPIFVQINELNPHLRKKHIMLAGIWVDTQHPVPNTFIMPFVSQANELYRNGIVWKPDGRQKVTSKFIPVIFNADSGARWDYLGMTQFNGKFGCTFCYAPGEIMDGKSNQAKYPVQQRAVNRTDEEIRRHGKEAFNLNKKVFGVKGPSSLTLLPEFDMCSSIVVDSMHNVFMGVFKLHMTLLLEDSKAPYYIGSCQNIAVIDSRISSIKLPNRISRKPRSIKFVKLYKASEWRNWGYFGLVCLEDILPKKYLKHLAQIFEVAYLLNKDSVTRMEIHKAETLLSDYVEKFQDYFGICHMTYNIHLLEHLCETVRHWGPFWVHSAFVFESMNRKIIQSITSSHGIILQVYTRFLMAKFIKNTVYDRSVSTETKNFISNLLNVKYNDYDLEPDEEINISFKILSKPVQRLPIDWEIQAIENAGFQCTELLAFDKARIGGIEYRRFDFKPNTTFQNTLVFCNVAGIGEILGIVSFQYENRNIEGIFIRRLLTESTAFGTSFIKEVSVTDDKMFVTTEDIRSPAFKTFTSGKLRVISLPNVWESD